MHLLHGAAGFGYALCMRKITPPVAYLQLSPITENLKFHPESELCLVTLDTFQKLLKAFFGGENCFY